MTFSGRAATSAFMLLLFTGACVLALELQSKAAFMPLLVGIPGAILSLWQLVIDLRNEPQVATAEKAEPEKESRSETEIFIWLAIFASAIIGFGFVVGGSLVVIAFIRISSRERWRNACLAGVGTFAVIYGIFVQLMELPLFPGLVIEALS